MEGGCARLEAAKRGFFFTLLICQEAHRHCTLALISIILAARPVNDIWVPFNH